MCGNGKCVYYGCHECMSTRFDENEAFWDDDGCGPFCSEECRKVYVLRMEEDE